VVDPPPPPPPTATRLAVPGRVDFGALTLRASRGAGEAPTPGRVAVRCDASLQVRPPRPGDRLPLPSGGHLAVGRLLAADGIPSRLRQDVPVVATAERVVWVAGHRAADDLIVRDSGPAVILELEHA